MIYIYKELHGHSLFILELKLCCLLLTKGPFTMRPPTNSSRIVFKVAKDWYATFTWCRQQKTSCVGQAIKSNKHLHVTITQFVINKKHQESASKGSYWWFVNPLILIGMFTHLNKPCKVRKLPQSPNPLPVADRIRDGILCSRSPNASTWEFNDCKTVLAICASKFYTWYLIISCKYTLCICVILQYAPTRI